jgi:hypothetical protein
LKNATSVVRADLVFVSLLFRMPSVPRQIMTISLQAGPTAKWERHGDCESMIHSEKANNRLTPVFHPTVMCRLPISRPVKQPALHSKLQSK